MDRRHHTPLLYEIPVVEGNTVATGFRIESAGFDSELYCKNHKRLNETKYRGRAARTDRFYLVYCQFGVPVIKSSAIPSGTNSRLKVSRHQARRMRPLPCPNSLLRTASEQCGNNVTAVTAARNTMNSGQSTPIQD